MYITNADELAAFCHRAASARLVAVDTEFIRERSYYPKLCLVQLATPEEIALVDPLELQGSMAALGELFADERVTKVFHACAQDLEVIYGELGVVPAPIFDTQVAAAFLGMRQQIGYGELVHELCGVRLPKAEALSDWSIRPLTDEQLSYAADDVRYLPGVYEQMIARLTEGDRLGWVMPEMEGMAAKMLQQRDPRCAYQHLKRSNTLTRKQLAVAREACAWREERAAEKNIPRRWLLSDEVIVECCRRVPRDAAAIKRVRGTEKLSQADVKDYLAALKRGTTADPSDLPRAKRREKPSPDADGVVDLLYALLRIISKECGIAPQVLATRDDLLELLQGRKDAALASGWRHEVAGARLEQLIAGEVGLTIKEGRIEVL